ncbi:MAG: hypothetical protein Q8O88_01085 [bacterium]|nr:hypothetical protein [bacterium]
MEKERQIDFAPWDFPKLKDVTPEGPIFDMRCPDCDSINIVIKPIGVAWRTQEFNSDLGETINRQYNTVPLLGDAVLEAVAQQKGILVICDHCKQASAVDIHVDRGKLNRWLNKKKM